MIKNVCSVHDRLTGHLSLFLEENDKVAMRNFAISVKNAGPRIEKSDIELYRHGTFDTETGKFNFIDGPVLLMTGNEVNTDVPNSL